MIRTIWNLVATSLTWLSDTLPSGLRYFYYLRVSLLIWLFPLVMANLNKGGARTLTSGILVPETWQQYLCVGFFILSTGLTALVIARIVVINGEDRFSLISVTELNAAKPPIPIPKGALPPNFLKALLNDDNSRFEILAVVIALVPASFTFWYIASNAAQEGVRYRDSIPGLLVGALLGLVFWAALNVLYYLLYKLPFDIKPGDQIPVKFGTDANAARTILFPRRLFGLPIGTEDVKADTIEAATVDAGLFAAFADRLMQPILHRIRLPGYVDEETHRIFEGQFFALLSVAGFTLAFLAIWPLTAPVPTNWSVVAVAVMLIAFGLLVFGLLRARRQSDGRCPWQAWSAAIALSIFALVFPAFYLGSDTERFPVFATILIAVTMLAWIFGGVAYFLDRFRVPVLTAMLLMVIVPRFWPGDKGREEHYLSIATVGTIATADMAPTPAEILQKWLDAKAIDPENPDQPVIIVTATGGGLHASAWTAAVLDQLELRFQQKNLSFYPNILLLSTVSGGSTGALSYLESKRAPAKNHPDPIVSAACSSLEAVGWGIIYHDLPATLLPEFFWPGGASSGIDDLAAEPMIDKDRTWALRSSFQRNLRDTYCWRQWSQDSTHVTLGEEQNDIAEARKPENVLTLRTVVVDPGKTPAFTMNTTTAEHGSRFLLANYAIPRYAIARDEALPAESFLQAFGTQNLSENNNPRYADLPLATAAQLSATFPYVSSAARFPQGGAIRSAHFIDGGYYDNDGTASVLEFLRYAMDDPNKEDAKKRNDCQNDAALQKIKATFSDKGKHLRVILVEIRNSADDPAEDLHSDDQANEGRGAQNLVFQLTAPLLGFWNAGHSSVTQRNRAALHLIEQAYSDRLTIHHIVIADTSHKTGDANTDIVTRTDPLNWSLTPRQRKEIYSSMGGTPAIAKYDEVVQWMDKSDALWKTAQPPVPATIPAVPSVPPPSATVAQP